MKTGIPFCETVADVRSPAPTPATDPAARAPKLLDQLRNEIRLRHYSIRTEQTYRDWVVRYVKYHNLRHPAEMGVAEISRFLTHLAVEGNVAASTQNHRVKDFAPRGSLQGD